MYCIKVTWRSLIWSLWWRSMGSGQTPVFLFTSTIFALGKTRPVLMSAIIYIFFLLNTVGVKQFSVEWFHSGSGIGRETRQYEETFYKENYLCNQRRIWQHENKSCTNTTDYYLSKSSYTILIWNRVLKDYYESGTDKPNSSGSQTLVWFISVFRIRVNLKEKKL